MTSRNNQPVMPTCKARVTKKRVAWPRLDVVCVSTRGVDIKLGYGQYFRETPGEWQLWDDWGWIRKYRKDDVVEVKIK